jgi:hypothetical protein
MFDTIGLVFSVKKHIAIIEDIGETTDEDGIEYEDITEIKNCLSKLSKLCVIEVRTSQTSGFEVISSKLLPSGKLETRKEGGFWTRYIAENKANRLCEEMEADGYYCMVRLNF